MIRRFLKDIRGYLLIELVMVIVIAGIAFPVIVTSFTQVYLNGGRAELMTISNAVAIQQMEIILADKAGTGVGFGYTNITSAKYASVDPPSPFDSFHRTVTVTDFNINGNASYPAKQIVVRVTHSLIPDVVLTAFITDHSAL